MFFISSFASSIFENIAVRYGPVTKVSRSDASVSLTTVP
jgi:hypothetical protein